jgi:four helix bundle protein
MDRPELEARADEFADRVEAFSRPLLDRPATSDAARQLRRAATGVASNYRSSGVGRSHDEFRAKLGIANDEAHESLYWLTYLTATRLARGAELDYLRDESRQLKWIFDAAYRTASGNAKRKRANRDPRKTPDDLRATFHEISPPPDEG